MGARRAVGGVATRHAGARPSPRYWDSDFFSGSIWFGLPPGAACVQVAQGFTLNTKRYLDTWTLLWPVSLCRPVLNRFSWHALARVMHMQVNNLHVFAFGADGVRVPSPSLRAPQWLARRHASCRVCFALPSAHELPSALSFEVPGHGLACCSLRDDVRR